MGRIGIRGALAGSAGTPRDGGVVMTAAERVRGTPRSVAAGRPSRVATAAAAVLAVGLAAACGTSGPVPSAYTGSGLPVTAVTATITVGSSPLSIVIDVAAGEAYVGNSGDGTVSVIATDTREVIDTITLGPSTSGVSGPLDLALDPNTGALYATFDGLLVIDTATHDVLDTIDVGPGVGPVEVDPETGTVYVGVTGNYGTTVAVVDPETRRVSDTVEVGLWPSAMTLEPRSGTLYVAHQGERSGISSIDTATNEVTATVDVGGVPISVAGLAADPDAGTVYVATGGMPGAGAIEVIDAVAHEITATIAVPAGATGLAVDPEADALYVTNNDRTVSVVDRSTREVIDTILVDAQALGIAVDHTTGAVFVSGWGTGSTVSVLETVEPEPGPPPASIDLSMADDGETVRVALGGLVVVRLPDDADLWSVSDTTWAGNAGTVVELCSRRDTCAREGCTRSSDLLAFRAIGTTKSRVSLVSMNSRFDVLVTTAGPADDASPGWADVEVTKADDGAVLDLALGDTLAVRLPSQIGLGMGWFLANEESIPMTSCGAGAWGPDWPAPVDAVYLEVLEFVPVSTGTTNLFLEYRDTAAPDAPPQDTFTLTVRVDR